MTEPTTSGAVPVEFLRGVIALCTQRGYSPENIEAWSTDDKWIADLWRQAARMLAAAPAQPAAEPANSAAYAALEKKHNDFLETVGLMLDAIGYTEDYARQWPKEKASVTFKRWFDEKLASHGQAPAGANENAKLVTLIVECRDAFPIPAHGDPIENYWIAAIADPANVPAYLQEIAKRKQTDSVQEDAARLDYLHSMGSTLEMLPGEVDFYPMRFRVGGLRSAVSPNLREAIDIARKQGEKQ